MNERVIPMSTSETAHATAREADALAAPALLKKASWASILLGAVIALGLMVVLNLIGLALGLYIVDFSDGEFTGAGWAMGVWWVMSAVVSLFAGGWVAGRLAGIPDLTTASAHGVGVWAVTTLLAVWMVSWSAAAAFTGMTGLASGVLSAGVQAARGSADLFGPVLNFASDRLAAELQRSGVSVDTAQLRRSAAAVMDRTISLAERQRLENLAAVNAREALVSPATAETQFRQFIAGAFGADGVIGPEDREQAIAALSNELGAPEIQVRQAVNNWQTQMTQAGDQIASEIQQIRSQSAVVADRAANAVASVSMWTAVGLLTALAAALAGGLVARPTVTALTGRDVAVGGRPSPRAPPRSRATTAPS